MSRVATAVVLAALTPALCPTPSASQALPAEYSLRFDPRSRAVQTGDATGLDQAIARGFSDEGEPLSASKAALYSLLLPGLGDYRSGHKGRAVVFFGVEAAIWTAFIVSRVQGDQRESSYQDYAVRFAGVSNTGHSDDFYALIREYDNSVEYEAAIKSEGRAALWPDVNQPPPDLDADQLERYFLENRVGDYEPWEWQSLQHKVQFQETRSASKNAYRRATFALAAAAANRVVSAVFTYTTVRRAASQTAADARRYQIVFHPPRRGYEAAVTLIRRF